MTELCLEACMVEFPPGHPKTFQRTLDIISLFVLAISNTVNLFPFFLLLFFVVVVVVVLSMKTLGK